jgi:hypothetical protein
VSSCKCTLAQRTVGDGCEICNPAKALDYAKDTIDDLQARVAELEAALRDLLPEAGKNFSDSDTWRRHYFAQSVLGEGKQ